jgi:NADPH:quinone reductase-like Zn-dependent oxidoreductase
MIAAIYTEYGPADVVRIADIPTPVPKHDELLVRVRASTVNRTDTGFRSAEYVVSRLFSGILKPTYPVLGSEFAGEVVAVGADVTLFKPGDRIFGFDDERFGGHAEFMVISQHSAIATIPEGWSYDQAAPLTEGSHYALGNLRAAGIKPGSRILINGSTGAIGSAAVQLSAHFGANITAVCATPHLDLVTSLGAHRVVDYTTTDVVSLGGEYDIVYDAVGKRRFRDFLPVLAPDGLYMSTELGPKGENIWLALRHMKSKKKRVIFPIPKTTVEDILFICELAVSGAFKPVFDRSYPLSDIVEAHRYVESGVKIGNVVIHIPE